MDIYIISRESSKSFFSDILLEDFFDCFESYDFDIESE